jgi:hypothetical protein
VQYGSAMSSWRDRPFRAWADGAAQHPRADVVWRARDRGLIRIEGYAVTLTDAGRRALIAP